MTPDEVERARHLLAERSSLAHFQELLQNSDRGTLARSTSAHTLGLILAPYGRDRSETHLLLSVNGLEIDGGLDTALFETLRGAMQVRLTARLLDTAAELKRLGVEVG